MNAKDLLNELVEARKNSSPLIRQVDVARHMGIGQPSVSELERGETEPRLDTLMKYAEAIGLKLEVTVRKVENYGDEV